MPIPVECGCGARFRVRDELAGRRGKCPKCGQALTIGPAATPEEQSFDVVDEPVPAEPAPAATRVAQAQPAGKAVIGRLPGHRRPQPKQAPARFAISPRMTLLIGAFIVIPTVIWIVKAGPVRAHDQWQVMEPQAQDDIKDVINKVLADREEAEWKSFEESMGPASGGGKITRGRPRYVPTVNTVLIDSPTLMWRLPEKIPFQGRIGQSLVAGFSAAGKPQLMNVRGFYHTRTRGVEAELTVEGTSVKVRGRIVAGAAVIE